MRINQLFVILFTFIIASFYLSSPLLAEPPIQLFHFNERLDKLKKDSYIACNDKRVEEVVRTYKQPKEAQVKLCFNKVKEIMLFSGVNAQKADSSVGFRHIITLLAEQGKMINNDITEYRVTLPIDPNQFDALKVANLAQKGKTMQCNLVAQLWVKNKKKKEDKLTFNITSSNDPNHIYVNHKHLPFSTFNVNPKDSSNDILEYHIEFANEPYQRLSVPDSVYIVFRLKNNFDTFVVRQHYLNVRFRDNTPYFSAVKMGDSIVFKFNNLHNNVYFADEKDDIFKGGLRFSVFTQKKRSFPPILRYEGNVFFFLDSQFVDRNHRHYDSKLKAIAEPFSDLRKVHLHGGYGWGLAAGWSVKAKPNANTFGFDIYTIDELPRFRFMWLNSEHSKCYPYISPEITFGTRKATESTTVERRGTANKLIIDTIISPNQRFLLADVGLFLRYNYLNLFEFGAGLTAEFALNENNITNSKNYKIPIQKYVCLDFSRKIYNVNIGARYYLPWQSETVNIENAATPPNTIQPFNRDNYYQIYIGLAFPSKTKYKQD